MNIDKRIGFSHWIPNETVEYVNAKYGDFPLASPIISIYSQQRTISTFFQILLKVLDNSDIKSSVFGRACNLPFEFLKIEKCRSPKGMDIF